MNILERVRNVFGNAAPQAAGIRALLISGFGWSGSGALIDYAADHAGVGGFRKGFEEGSVLKGLYSLAVFYRGVVANKPRTATDIENLAEALSGKPGLSATIQPQREFVNIKRNENMRRELGDERVDAAVAELVRRLMAKVDRASGKYRGSPADVLAAGSEFLETLKRASLDVRFKEQPEFLILNNDPPGYSVDLFRFHRNARYTVVTRDLTDVFATLLELKRIETDDKAVRNFVRAQRKKVVNFESALLAETDAVRRDIAIVEFERFVGVESVRNAWHDFCGFSREKVGEGFNPEISQRNAGIGERLPAEVRQAILDGVETARRALLERLRDHSGVRVL